MREQSSRWLSPAARDRVEAAAAAARAWMPDNDAEIDALYQGPLEAFTDARNALAKSAKRADIKTLQKPSLPAWAVNQLFWHRRPVIDRLVKAAEAVRLEHGKTLAGKAADIRAAEQAHRDAVKDALAEARTALGEAGHPLTAATLDAVRDTLQVLPSPEANGRLTRPLAPQGFAALAGFTVAAGTARVCALSRRGRRPLGPPSRGTLPTTMRKPRRRPRPSGPAPRETPSAPSANAARPPRKRSRARERRSSAPTSHSTTPSGWRKSDVPNVTSPPPRTRRPSGIWTASGLPGLVVRARLDAPQASARFPIVDSNGRRPGRRGRRGARAGPGRRCAAQPQAAVRRSATGGAGAAVRRRAHRRGRRAGTVPHPRHRRLDGGDRRRRQRVAGRAHTSADDPDDLRRGRRGVAALVERRQRPLHPSGRQPARDVGAAARCGDGAAAGVVERQGPGAVTERHEDRPGPARGQRRRRCATTNSSTS